MTRISIIIPVLNEAESIRQTLLSLQSYRNNGHEVIMVDGGSNDNTVQLAKDLVDILVVHSPGRAQQMNAGVKSATGDIYLFLHADTVLPEEADKYILSCQKENSVLWGRFNVTLSGKHWLFRIIEFCMNTRTRLTGVVTGDHAMFIDKKLFEKVNGFPEIDLMEDIAISKKLRKLLKPASLEQTVITSSRRWEKHGIIKTILKMWWFRFRYMLGTDPLILARQYD